MNLSFLQEDKPFRRTTLKAHVTDVLRKAIIEGKLKPGQQLRQDKIAAALGVSSIPVREAFSALSEERHVIYRTNRGAFVSDIDAEKVREIYEIRFFLESGALSLSLPKLRQTDYEEAERLMHLEAKETDANKKVCLDLAFHRALCRPCGRPYLLQLIEKIHDHVARYVNLTIYLMNFKRHPEYNHSELFKSCKRKKIEETTDILKQHFKISTDMICSKFEPSARGEYK